MLDWLEHTGHTTDPESAPPEIITKFVPFGNFSMFTNDFFHLSKSRTSKYDWPLLAVKGHFNDHHFN